jgi:hypothetical protein
MILLARAFPHMREYFPCAPLGGSAFDTDILPRRGLPVVAEYKFLLIFPTILDALPDAELMRGFIRLFLAVQDVIVHV